MEQFNFNNIDVKFCMLFQTRDGRQAVYICKTPHRGHKLVINDPEEPFEELFDDYGHMQKNER